jgi:hypothetical protein
MGDYNLAVVNAEKPIPRFMPTLHFYQQIQSSDNGSTSTHNLLHQ